MGSSEEVESEDVSSLGVVPVWIKVGSLIWISFMSQPFLDITPTKAIAAVISTNITQMTAVAAFLFLNIPFPFRRQFKILLRFWISVCICSLKFDEKKDE